MKKLILSIACIYSLNILIAQKIISEAINISGAASMEMSFEYADVQIEYWDQQEINVSGKVIIADGENNDNHILSLNRTGNQIKLNSSVENEDDIPYIVTAYDEEGNVLIKKNVGKRKKGESWGDMGDGLVDAYGKKYKHYNYSRNIEIQLVIKVPKGFKVFSESEYGDTKIENASGPIEINNTYGFVEAKFSQDAKIENCILNSTYDFVDVSLPNSTQATIRMQSNYGDLLTDLELDVDKSKSKSGSFNEVIFANVNGGGPTIEMKATYDNVYLRKG